MKFEELPQYTTERYYLLSEIEQLSDITVVNEVISIDYSNRYEYGVNYVLWDLTVDDEDYSHSNSSMNNSDSHANTNANSFNSDNNDTIVHKADELLLNKINELGKFTKQIVLRKKVLSIDGIITKGYNINYYYNRIQKMMNLIKLTNYYDYICIGISNDESGTPGLELCYNYINGITTEIPYLTNKIITISVTRNDFLGHNPNREPDAGSNIYQLRIYDTNNFIDNHNYNNRYNYSPSNPNSKSYSDNYSVTDNNITDYNITDYKNNMRYWVDTVITEWKSNYPDLILKQTNNYSDKSNPNPIHTYFMLGSIIFLLIIVVVVCYYESKRMQILKK